MPRMSGNELFAALRAHTATRNVPIIMLSAQAGAEARSQALEAGMDDYLVGIFFLVMSVVTELRRNLGKAFPVPRAASACPCTSAIGSHARRARIQR